MKHLTIRKLLFVLIGSGLLIAVAYSLGSYYYLKQATEKAIQMESLNRAHSVTKQMSGLYDSISYEYGEREDEIYEVLKEAQHYFKANGRQASLEVLKRELMEGREGSIYEIFLINRRYIIEATTYQPDLGMDFTQIPDAHKVLKDVFENPKSIDLSVITHSGSNLEMRRYIVQHAMDGDYMVQIGLTMDRSYLQQPSILSLQKKVPTLISTKVYQVFSSIQAPQDVERWWTMEYQSPIPINMEKVDYGKVTIDFDAMIAAMVTLPSDFSKREQRYQYFKYQFDTRSYLETYFWRDRQYVHQVVMPLFSRFNNYNESINLLVMEFDESESRKTLLMLNVMVGLLWVLLAFFALMAIWLVHTRIVAPLSLMQTRMQDNEGMPLLKIPNKRDEVGSISRAYNQLLDDLHREIYSNKVLLHEFKTFAGNAIHQIRTPLSVIKIALEMAESQNREAEQQIEASLVSIEHMYDTLSYMVQHDKVEYRAEKIDLSMLFAKRVKIFQVVAEANDIGFDVNIQPSLFVMMNAIEAEYLVDNNLSNAIKFSKPDSVVSLSLRRTNDEVILSFWNFGEAIEDSEAIFQRYEREDKSRSGSGIGLNMVDTICKHNNILIKVDYANDQNQFSYFIEAM